jgi:hypothetical protein
MAHKVPMDLRRPILPSYFPIFVHYFTFLDLQIQYKFNLLESIL